MTREAELLDWKTCHVSALIPGIIMHPAEGISTPPQLVRDAK